MFKRKTGPLLLLSEWAMYRRCANPNLAQPYIFNNNFDQAKSNNSKLNFSTMTFSAHFVPTKNNEILFYFKNHNHQIQSQHTDVENTKCTVWTSLLILGSFFLYTFRLIWTNHYWADLMEKNCLFAVKQVFSFFSLHF